MDLQEPTFHVGDIFNKKSDLQLTCKEYTIQANIEFKTVKSDNRHYSIKCKGTDCNWRLYASNIENTCRFAIKIYEGQHNCYGLFLTSHKQVTESFIASRIQEKLRQQLSYNSKKIKKDLKHELNVDVKYHKIWHAKELVMENFNDSVV